MAVYNRKGSKERGCENMRIYQNCPRNIAADIPPNEDKRCENEDKYTEQYTASPLKSIIDDMLDGGIDSDKLLVAVLLYLLIKEGADIKLIIALGYILM
ncbi:MULTISPECIES: hypothetical protein [Ruminococcus]|jgi:hypothetical protein|uniref:Uncharacterized protein n=1 Tax=Ruminococcus flavefaciens TaxID=1265 RepID=A0A315Y4C0_RUMFL|nr:MULTISPECIES: hypothetical protein [Ruminococcus]MBQ9895542.1 hypothetical protein [Ruminococcus sp.]MBR1431630.1 hypothetical protein [Ruminococcus sp.]PWJ15209.1 hypothetical protein IE37_00103 [Ruminococcus flavefaciens]SSA40255.1 hypothetical protein SAMN02910325_00103 [Ruminococcus flavefaciens]